MTVSHDALDSGLTKASLLEKEATLNSDQDRWTGLLCIYAFINCVINIRYPDFGQNRSKVMFSQSVFPRGSTESSNVVYILCCFEGVCGKHKHNHYVPLAFETPSVKR